MSDTDTADIQHISLPSDAIRSLNRCNIPAAHVGSLAFQRNPRPLLLDGVAQLHQIFFDTVGPVEDQTERCELFAKHMRAAFQFDHPQHLGHMAEKPRPRASYRSILRGWHFDSESREGAVIKGWVESRFGLMPRYHKGQIRAGTRLTRQTYYRDWSEGLEGTSSLEAQLDLLYSFCQAELLLRYPALTHVTLYRGVNRIDDFETLYSPNKHDAVILLNNINSFTQNRDRAGEFGDYILTCRVPLPKVFCFDGLLAKTLTGEAEVMVLGGAYRVKVSVL